MTTDIRIPIALPSQLIFYIISSFVISGLYNLADPISLLVGAFFKQSENEFYEKSDKWSTLLYTV
mgnify:CR=1 FL=1